MAIGSAADTWNGTGHLKPLPVGVSDYIRAQSEYYYVDKTLLIKELLDQKPLVTLFARPRRFGKTLNMDMLRVFFEKTEMDTSCYFSGRAIWSCGDFYRAYQGAFPVIFLSFKDAHQSTWKDLYESLSMTLRNEFKRHRTVLDSDAVQDIDKAFFRRMLQGDVTEVECQASLGRLSHFLSEAYGTRVVVIVDEYDTPIQQGYSNGYYNEVVSFIRNLFSAVLKDNPVLEFGILTGILRIARESLFSGLNNLNVNTILDEKYSEYFGFTVKDVEEMAGYYSQTEKLTEISDWYDGYRFGRSEIYNPWSVISYFSNGCIPKAFWSRTSGNDMIPELIRNSRLNMQEALTELLQNKPVQAVIDTDIIYPEIGSSEDTVYSFLVMTGYLKPVEIVNIPDDSPVCDLLIPNREIKGVFKKEILDSLPGNITRSVIRSFRLVLRTNNKDALQSTLRQYLLQAAGSFDTAQENFYHGMMLGLLAIMSDDYLIASNRESGEGRFDIQLKPFSLLRPGILMEFKALKDADEKQLDRLADNAIKQVLDKQYATDLISNEITDIQIYGIAFSGKKATVKTMRLG